MMAPNGEGAVAAAAAAPAPAAAVARGKRAEKPRRISMEGLQRAMSDLALELTKKQQVADAAAGGGGGGEKLPEITEQQQVVVEEARCECCGMQEECTPEYARRVRERYCGRWVCGLCAAAASAEADRRCRHGGTGWTTATAEEALAAHMAVCGRFNRVGRANPGDAGQHGRGRRRRLLLTTTSTSSSPPSRSSPSSATGSRTDAVEAPSSCHRRRLLCPSERCCCMFLDQIMNFE
ncbi:hypothetical protein EE612_000858 [Oryza sativa]|nr:hypothetical protein EE612_000858 [Oryza sativa]